MTSSGRLACKPRFLGVGLDEFGDAVDQRMRDALARPATSRQARSCAFASLPAVPLKRSAMVEQALGRVRRGG